MWSPRWRPPLIDFDPTTPTPTPDPRRESIRAELAACRSDHDRFNSTILGRSPYWSRQREVCRAVRSTPAVFVPAGNGVGKSYLDAGLLHSFLLGHPGCMVLATAPSQTQLEEVLWKEVERSYHGARIPLGGRLLKSPLKVDLGDGWHALAYSTTKTERLSGHHSGDLLAILDEASGVAEPIWEAIDSCNPSRLLCTGNPLRPDGQFYERCTRAENEPSALAKLVRISSLESPDIDLPRSPRGLADATWLAKVRRDYGEDSTWWLAHVLALFPDAASDSLLPRDWLDAAGRAEHVPWGTRRIAIDLGGGNGGDLTVVLCRDDNGLLDLRSSNTWDLAAAAEVAAEVARRWRVDPSRISWDVAGIGIDFANRLKSAGLRGCRPYNGGGAGNSKFGNLRSAAAWHLRLRLDPHRQTDQQGAWREQAPFAIRPDWLALIRPELQGLRYALDTKGRVALEVKEEFARRLRRSPNFADALGQSFAYPNT